MVFAEWIEREMKSREWTRQETARRGGISISMLDKVLSGHAEPGRKFLDGLAKAFRMDPVDVYQAAGVLQPRKPVTAEEEKLIEQINRMMEGLSEESKKDIYEYARMRRRLEEERSKYNDASHPKPHHSGA